MKEINWDQFVEQYNPIQNHLDYNASMGGYMFETFGDEFDYVLQVHSINTDRVWTVLVDSGKVDIVNGLCFVNRLGYIVTKLPADVAVINVIDEDYVEEITIKHKRSAVLDDMIDSCLNDSGYLAVLLGELIDGKSDDEIEKMYSEVFDY